MYLTTHTSWAHNQSTTLPSFTFSLPLALLLFAGGLEEEAAKITHSSPQEPKTRNSLWKPFAPSHSLFPSLHFLCLFNLKPFYWHVNYYLVKNMFTWNDTKKLTMSNSYLLIRNHVCYVAVLINTSLVFSNPAVRCLFCLQLFAKLIFAQSFI